MDFGFAGKQLDIFSPLTEENRKRIRKQNGRKISVIIGNPPYNANQANENDNNKNRDYPAIDKRIKDTFIAKSTAQKTKLYDMYSRFYRWAFDRLDSNGIIAFVTNRSFIDSRTFDGFRKCIQDEFDYAYIIDSQSDVRANPKISGTSHNVFGIQTGVAIMFLIHKTKKENKVCDIRYISQDDFWRKEQKLQWFSENPIRSIEFDRIVPDKKNNWINQSNNDFDTLIPLIDKNVKKGISNKAIFSEFSIGTNTARDEWVYSFNSEDLKQKVTHLVKSYNQKLTSGGRYDNDRSIKWTRGLKQRFDKGLQLHFNASNIISANYRPFAKRFLYHSTDLVEMPSRLPRLIKCENQFITFSGSSHSKPFQSFIVDGAFSFDFLEKTTGVPLYNVLADGQILLNVTDWAQVQFSKYYKDKKIDKVSIFNYVYAVLLYPNYKSKYALNLKRDFPRIPLYKDFHKWAAAGKELIKLHLNYQNVNPYSLNILSTTTSEYPKVKLRADKNSGTITIDENTILIGIPREAWEYKLGNRSALEWILDQYKESKPKDPVIADLFDTYQFADYKEQVIDLLKKVCTVSVETMKIVNGMSED